MPRRTRIKICGITSAEAARVAVEAGADAIGIVLADGSPRRVDFRTAHEILDVLPPFVTGVVVLRDPEASMLAADARSPLRRAGLVQLHGDEDERTVEAVPGRVIRGIAFEPSAIRRWAAHPRVEAVLVDGPLPGSGAAFDHRALADMMQGISKPVILAGGLTPANVADAIRVVRPYAVDVSTGVESAPGVKDGDLVRAFCEAVRGVD